MQHPYKKTPTKGRISQNPKLSNSPYDDINDSLLEDPYRAFGPPDSGIDAQFPMNNQGVRSRSPRRAKSPPRHQVKKEIVGQTNHVSFNILYETKMGESICVLGSTQELGAWKEYKCNLVWTEGHIWVSKEPVVTKSSRFFYKYVLLDEGKMVKWEMGIDRIADLTILPTGNTQVIIKDKDVKYYEMNDVWQQFNVRFSVFDPFGAANDTLWLDSPTLGKIDMKRSNKTNGWLESKYGKNVETWECTIKQANDFQNNEGEFLDNGLTFKYQYCRQRGEQVTKEREPMRAFELMNPKTYECHLSQMGTAADSQWKICDKVQIVNGVVEKADGTFLHGFLFNEVGEKNIPYNIILGSYPLFEVDVKKISQEQKITAVLSLQTDEEVAQRGINERSLVEEFRRNGIRTYYRYGISDDDEQIYCEDLFEAQQILYDLIENRKERVYLHCTSGMTRCPSLACVYACLNMKSSKWQNPYEVEQIIMESHRYSSLNMKAVAKTIKDNAWYTQEILEKRRQLQLEKERLLREEQAYRVSLDRITRQEHEKLIRQRDDYLRREKERFRLEQERLRMDKERLRKQREDDLERQRQHEKMLIQRRQQEEQERQRMIQNTHITEEQLMQKLNDLENEEAERLRMLQKKEEENLAYEHYIQGDVDYTGVTDQEIEEQCEELFAEAPIKFVARKGEKVDQEVKRMVEEMNITIPIIWIKQNLFLVGNKTINLEKKGEYVTGQIGGGYEKFDEYIQRSHKRLEKDLVIKMIQSQESLQFICQALINGQKISSIQSVARTKINDDGSSPSKRFSIVKKVSEHNAQISSASFSPRRTYNSGSSPIRKSKTTVMSSPKTPSSPIRRSPTRVSKSPIKNRNMSASSKTMRAQINQDQQVFQQRKEELVRQLQLNHESREQHMENNDQTNVNNNKGQYSYIHQKQY